MASKTTKAKQQRKVKRSNDSDVESPYFKSSKRTKKSTVQQSAVMTSRLGLKFYNQPCIKLAKALLGQTLVRILDSGERLAGKIVETESYLGAEDSAAHTYKGHKSANNEAMYMTPGTTYVYLIYGMYSCLNISSKGMWLSEGFLC